MTKQSKPTYTLCYSPHHGSRPDSRRKPPPTGSKRAAYPHVTPRDRRQTNSLRSRCRAGVRIVIAMGKPRSVHTVAATAAALRVDLIRTAQHTAQIMHKIATTYTKAAATYRRMARQQGRPTLRYQQHAAWLDQRATRARQFAEHERHQSDQQQHPTVANTAD